jgi:hypothetical protein
MFDCSKEVLGYHNDEVTLPQAQRTAMRNRRDSNRTRVCNGLKENEDPQPSEFESQGSYAMKTMVQHPENDYDIDDGIYFEKDDLKGRNGAEKSALQARQMVRDAVDDGSFKRSPEARKNCVRVYYEAGYHVDIPVYRRVVTKNWLGGEDVYFELAASDWKRSDARDVTEWFNGENRRQSPDTLNGRQLRRMCREIKKFSQSRASWKSQIASGFMITKLVTECYRPNGSREDTALHDTMRAIRDRLNYNLSVQHPVTPNETITKGNDDPKARFLRDKLSDALSWLEVLFSPDCTRKDALAAWDKVFNTTYFTDKLESEKRDALRQVAARVTTPSQPWLPRRS